MAVKVVLITINEIAKMANVSRTTVSRVLNNSGYVSEEARERVYKVIKDTNFVPSEYAKSLRTKKSKVVGVILPRISTETSSKVVMGIDSVLSKEGYQILLANTNLNIEKEIEFLKLLISRQVEGIILVATNVSKKLVDEVQNLKIPFVAIGQDLPGISSVVFDDYYAAKELTQLFIKKGKKRIAYIGVSESDQAVGFYRKKGFLDALNENNLSINEDWIRFGNFKAESGYEVMKSMIESSKIAPDSVFGATDRLAIGAMKYLLEKGFHIPKDIAVAGIGASDLLFYVTPALTTINYENERSGSRAAEVLLQQLNGELKGVKKITLDYRLVERDSL